MLYTRFFFFALALLAASLSAATESAATDETLLDPEQAYRLEVRAIDKSLLEARWRIADGYYLYRKKFGFATKPDTLKTGEPIYPPGKIKDDEFFGKVETYRNEVAIRVPLPPDMPEKFALAVTSQGCSDLGVCFPPQTQQVDVDLAVVPAATSGNHQTPVDGDLVKNAEAAPTAAVAASSDGNIEGLLSNGSLLLILTSFFGFGLALSLTPCVFPMIPILSGIIVKHGEAISRSRAALLSSVYVLGMALTYSLAGVGAGLSGSMLSSSMQNPWVLGAFAAMFVVLSLSMFGLFELTMPHWLQNRFSSAAGSTRSGSMGGIALMGALSALIVGPCIAPPLAGALLYIAKTGDATLGGAALFVMALGMGVPLMLVGVFSREILPKAGGWMNVVTKGFGVALLATALWIVSPVLPGWALMLSAATLLITTSMYLHALDPLPHPAKGWTRLWKGVGVAMLVAGCSLLIGVLGGGRDILQPLAGLRIATAAEEKSAVKFERVNSIQELRALVETSTRPVVLDFYADWCVSCKEMEKLTFTDPAVQKQLSKFTLLQVDVTENLPVHKDILKQYGLFGPPAVIMLDRDSRAIEGKRVIGYMPAQEFQKVLERT